MTRAVFAAGGPAPEVLDEVKVEGRFGLVLPRLDGQTLLQLLQADAISFCQIDSCRLGGVNEVLAVMLMAAKFGVPVCPHAGGVGLCEYVQHLSLVDYIAVSASLENRIVEYVDHLHEHFVFPAAIRNGNYLPPLAPGYSIEMKADSLDYYEFPNGQAWKR